MRELVEKIRQQFWGSWRFRWTGLVVALLIALGGWTLVYLMPNIYEAQAQVYVDTDSILRPLLAGLTVQNNLKDHVKMMRLALLSRPNLQQVAQKTDLALQATTPQQMSGLIDQLRNEISVTNRRRSNLYTISFKDSDSHQARNVVQALLNIFMEDSLNSNQSDNAGARSFLKKQLDIYKNKLNTAEQKLANFKKKHVGEMPNQGQDYYDRLQTAVSQVQQTKTQLKVEEQRQDELQQASSGEQPTFAFTPPAPVQNRPDQGIQSAPAAAAPSPLQKQIKSMELKLNNMLLEYTNQYPGVIELKKQIALLKKEAKKEAKSQPRGHIYAQQPVTPLSTSSHSQPNSNQPLLNPIYQETLMSLNTAKANVAALKAQLQQQQQHVAQLKSKINVIPEVEAKLSSLTRNYSVMQKRYHQLLQRYEEAQLANTASSSSDQVKFRVINPPFVYPKPVGPKRGRFLVMVLLLALGSGGGFAFFLHQIRPVFLDAQQLRQVTGLPVLGTVSRVWTGRRRGATAVAVLQLAGGLVVLIGLFALALVFRNTGSEVLREALKGLI